MEANLKGVGLFLGPNCMEALEGNGHGGGNGGVPSPSAMDSVGWLWGRGALGVGVQEHSDFCADAVHVLAHALDNLYERSKQAVGGGTASANGRGNRRGNRKVTNA